MALKAGRQRRFVPAWAELLDRLTVDLIKEIKLPRGRASYRLEIRALLHDIDLVIGRKKLKLSAKLLHRAILLGQLNLHVWHLKDRMKREPRNYQALLKLAHQLNGARNQIKNDLLGYARERTRSKERSNRETDGLRAWKSPA